MAIQVISEIVQKNNQDFPVADANNLRGGFYSVQSISDRDTIPEVRRKPGMLVYVIDIQKYYRLENNSWIEAKFGSDSIPVYDQEMLDNLGSDVPDKYITIPNKYSDLSGSPISREIEQTGTYVDILFSAIRKLQSEVARLRNSFKYGIYSYTDTNTAMSEAVNGITDPDDEPLWAIEEEDLSQIYSLTIGEGAELEPSTNVNIGTEGIIKITGDATWTDLDGTIKDAEDPKLFLYLCTSNLNTGITFTGTSKEFTLNLNTLDIPTTDMYNVMICISRAKESISGELEGSNFIYFSIGNTYRDQILKEGYLNNMNKLQDSRFDLDDTYYIRQVLLHSDTNITKLNFCTKYQDFSKQVIPSAPTEEDYKYKVAHITIRSVSSQTILEEIQNQLPNNELIFVENTKRLWIKNNDQLINIGSSGGGSEPGDSGMTETEIIELLKEMGIVREEGDNLHISDLADLTFIHQDTNQRFKLSINSDGELVSQKVPNDSDLLDTRVKNSEVTLNENVRGFIGQLRIAENNKTEGNVDIAITQDARIYADRVKIGAFYAPLSTDQVFGCTRAFVELENTADCDFSLQGCYLHYTGPNNIGVQTVYHLPLTGTIPAGGTYLIVGKRYAEDIDSNSYIKVDSYDQEWYIDGELIDFTIKPELENVGYGFALTYGNENLGPTDRLYRDSDSGSLSGLGISSASKFPYLFQPSFIDAIYYYKGVLDDSNKGYWADMVLAIKSNTMYKNMFELDPAKQAFQACTTADSSRTRWQSTNDVWILDLSKPEISFPHSEDTYEISKFQPKASYLHKNVQTDKSRLDLDKPNMVNCSFGTNIYTTRCFNWISAGYYDEFVWLRKKDTQSWTLCYESYKPVDTAITKPSSWPNRKEYSKELNNAAYARIVSRFPADNTQYTSHKCVVQLNSSSPSSKEVWEYVVGRKGKDGNPDPDHTSDIQTFTLYPETYTPVIYQTSDQQGFHWVEYQVWAAAANKLLEKIKKDESQNIIPIVINTGDMTQNGTRVSEWLDYYQAGRNIFKDYETMNVVGNNDLCGTVPTILGTGDDQGKSNSYYFHIFYCYDIDESVFVPLVNNVYIPSLYFFDSKDYRIIMCNSEITQVNCQQWYNLVDGEDIINIYTGFTIGTENKYHGEFTSIYTMIYHMLNTEKECVVACHEMPFTVITNASISNGQEGVSRSLSNANALVGSHMNQISNLDKGKGIYWFSRLLEHKGVKLVLGGHKHTYACTYPLREYFLFGEGKNSKDNYEEYQMEETLENDNVTWISESKDLTKYPLTKREDVGSAPTGFYPYTPVPDLEGGVTYFMCQATGYKLTSNKELPSANQKFSLAIPQTSNTGGSDKANDNQKYPMFAIIKLQENKDEEVKLVRVANIFNSGFKFAQNTYSTDAMKLQYFEQVSGNNYGRWVDDETVMLTV